MLQGETAVLGIGEPWPICLEGMEECYILEPLVIRGLIHIENLGIAFFHKYRLQMSRMEEEAAPMPKKDESASRAWLGRGQEEC